MMAEMTEADTTGGLRSPLLTPSPNDTVWADVSSLFRLTCNDLQSEELIHGENFNLFAAMSALEIMDPKMDSGIVTTYYSVDEAIQNNAAPVPLSFDRTLDVYGVIDVMDHILACEATWHKGGSLAQTVFSSIYILRPARTSSYSLLHSFCRVTRATCHALISAVSDARTNEEEDLFTMAYNLPLKDNGDEKCLSVLHAVEETVARQLKACKALSSKKRVSEDVEPLQNNMDLEERLCKAVLCRLRFRKYFYHMLTCMRKPQGKGFELAKKHLATCSSELDSMLKSEFFLRPSTSGTSSGVEDETTASGREPMGFDSTINSRSAAPTPPRSVKLLGWKKAVAYFQKLLHDLEVICSYSLDPNLESALRFLVDFQKFEPDLVARAHIQLLLVQDEKLYGRNHMFAVICKAAHLPEGTKSPDIQNNECVEQLGQLVITLLKVLCTNISWQRRKLGKILQDWRIMSAQLELAFRRGFGHLASTSADHQNMSLNIWKHILIWVDEQTYWIALRFLVLGFELELYSPSEYCMVYWYVYIILIKLTEKTHLKIMLSSDSNSSRKKAKKKRDSVKDVGKDNQIPPPALLLQCYICIAEGLMMMLASLRNERKVFLCHGPFNSEQERFKQHFDLLQRACLPDHTSYISFTETTAHARLSNLAVYNCFKEAQKIAKELRGSFANDPYRMAEICLIEQVAEHNNVALNLLCRLGNLDPKLKVSFEFVHHPHFAVATVKRSWG